MPKPTQLQAHRFAHAKAIQEYQSANVQAHKDALLDVVRYYRNVIAELVVRPTLLTTTVIVGKPTGNYKCCACGRRFGENLVGRTQSRRAYLELHCPHCLACWYEDMT